MYVSAKGFVRQRKNTCVAQTSRRAGTHAAPCRFALSPAPHLPILILVDACLWIVVGCFHTHPTYTYSPLTTLGASSLCSLISMPCSCCRRNRTHVTQLDLLTRNGIIAQLTAPNQSSYSFRVRESAQLWNPIAKRERMVSKRLTIWKFRGNEVTTMA